jgi:hypothetical protein
MTQDIKNDPNDKGLFSNEGVKELIPPFNFNYRTHEIELDEVEDVIARVTDHMVHLEASDSRFLYTCRCICGDVADESGRWQGYRFD